jgi:hypothetical protein
LFGGVVMAGIWWLLQGWMVPWPGALL